MSAHATAATPTVLPAFNKNARHRVRLWIGYFLAIALVLGLILYGFDYYTLDSTLRPFSPKHAMLKPSGSIGVKLGFLGFVCFVAIFLYPLRKRWDWLGRQGSSKHWLDVHVLLGLSAPFIIAFHSAFKFRGIAGMAFWIMLAVSISGVVGRYLYGQIPRRVTAAELSLKESKELQAQLTEQLAGQKLMARRDLELLFRLPSPERVQRWPMIFALLYMVFLDFARPFRIAGIRRHALGFGENILTAGGLLATSHRELEHAIQTAREQAALSKRILFLSRSQQVFHLWHVVHKPFSYSFAVLALVHVTVALLLGYL